MTASQPLALVKTATVETPRVAKLTAQSVDRLRFADLAPAGARHVVVWDEKLAGFGLRIMRSGVRAWVCQYRADGRRRRITIGRYGVLTAHEARERVVRILAAVSDGLDPLADRQARREAPTVGNLLDRYLEEHVAKKNRPRTAVEVKQLVERFIRPALGRHKVAAVTRDDMARLHSSLSRTPRQANFMLAVCSKAFNLAERWGLRSAGAGNPCRLIERFDEAQRDRFLSGDELGRLGTALRLAVSPEGLPWKVDPLRGPSKHSPRPELRRTPVAAVIVAAVEMLLFTGMRRGEALGLRWADVDLRAGTLALPETKSGRAQVVVINAPTRALLEALRVVRNGSPWVLHLPASPKRPLAPEVLQNAWERIRAASGLPDVRLHDLRHTVGTHASLTGANAFAIRDLLRHQDISMTGRYVNRADAALRLLSDAVGQRIAAGLSQETGADEERR